MLHRLLKSLAPLPVLAAALFLAACGGGGGSSTAAPPVVIATPSTAPSLATASGKVVDDGSGAPLAGVNVGLAPWTTAAMPTPVGTTAPDGSFTFTAQPGHYLLVIGSDSTSDTTRATIHDNVTLLAGANALQAPVLPPWPTVTPPPWETNGTYRLGVIDATTMLPCLNAYNTHRVGAGLQKVVEDEWLQENVRDITAWHRSGVYNPANQTAASRALTTGNSSVVGGSNCASGTLALAYSGTDATYSGNLMNQWFAGTYASNAPGDPNAFGVAEFPNDPRFQSDPIGLWP